MYIYIIMPRFTRSITCAGVKIVLNCVVFMHMYLSYVLEVKNEIPGRIGWGSLFRVWVELLGVALGI